MVVFCGIDWAEDHHDVALVDQDGTLLAKRRIGDDAAGYGAAAAAAGRAGDGADAPIPVAIETSRGLLVACLRATGRQVFAINPMAVARYRDRHSVAGKKSDHGDALVLANILRTDLAAHRPLPADSELAQAIAVLARAQQDAVWDRTTRTTSCARCCASTTRPSSPPSPTSAAGCCAPRPAPSWRPRRPRPPAAALTRPSCGRCSAAPAASAASTPRPPGSTPSSRRAAAPATHGRRGVGSPGPGPAGPARRRLPSADELAAAATRLSTSTPTPPSSPAFPAWASSPAPGCSPRSATTAPASPTPEASRPMPERTGHPGQRQEPHRHAPAVKNQRLAAAGYLWAFAALTASPGARAHYDRRKTAGDRHTAAQRNLFNRLLGCLHHCLTTGPRYQERVAFPAPQPLRPPRRLTPSAWDVLSASR